MPLKYPPPDLQEGQEALPSFEALYVRYHEQIYRYMYAHLKHEHDAADLMQQVFFQAWKQRQTFESRRGSVATWLFSIAHHRLIDFYRVSHPALSWESIPEMPTSDQSPEEHVLTEETLAQVRALLASLSQPEQELLALRFAGRLSSAKIASIIGKSEAATKKQLTRLLSRLQEQYHRQALDDLLPIFPEPALPAFVAALHQVYAVSLPEVYFQTIRQSLLEQIYLTIPERK